MFKSIIEMVLYPLFNFQDIFLSEFVIFCLIMWLFTIVIKGFFRA